MCIRGSSASWREAREESGLQDLQLLTPHIFDVDIHAIPARKDEPEHFHYDIRYAFQADRHAELIVTSESRELAWVALNGIETLTTEESVLRWCERPENVFVLSATSPTMIASMK